MPRYLLHEFLISAGAAKRTGESNSSEWNDRWRSKCEFLVGEQLINQFYSESAIQNLTKYLLTDDFSYFIDMLLSELSGQWTDPGLVASGLLTGVNGLYFMNSIESGSSRVLLNSQRKLQSKFKHASDFGVMGKYSKANAVKYSSALNRFLNSPGVKTIKGTYRGKPVIHNVNPKTGINIITNSSGEFISGWKLNSAQLQNVLKNGSL